MQICCNLHTNLAKCEDLVIISVAYLDDSRRGCDLAPFAMPRAADVSMQTMVSMHLETNRDFCPIALA